MPGPGARSAAAPPGPWTGRGRGRSRSTSCIEDRDCLVIDKPAGLGRAPGGGQSRATRCRTRLLGLDPALAAVPRAGIVHRLDKDTSGLLVVARNARGAYLADPPARRRAASRATIWRVCRGLPTGGGTIDRADRPPSHRPPAHGGARGRPAGRHALSGARALSRPHSCRREARDRPHPPDPPAPGARAVPIVGDPVYGGRFARPRGAGGGRWSPPCAASSARRCMRRTSTSIIRARGKRAGLRRARCRPTSRPCSALRAPRFCGGAATRRDAALWLARARLAGAGVRCGRCRPGAAAASASGRYAALESRAIMSAMMPAAVAAESPRACARRRDCRPSRCGCARCTASESRISTASATATTGASPAEADAVVTRRPGRVCAILTADCLPVLFAADGGEAVGAAHAGWRGLGGGRARGDGARARRAARSASWPGSGPASVPGITRSAPRCGRRCCRPTRTPRRRFAPNATRALSRGSAGARAPPARGARGRAASTESPTAPTPMRIVTFRIGGTGDCGRQAALIWIEPGSRLNWRARHPHSQSIRD